MQSKASPFAVLDFVPSQSNICTIVDCDCKVAEVTRSVSVHPSVVIVGANNENEIGMGWYEATRANLPLYIVDYAKYDVLLRIHSH